MPLLLKGLIYAALFYVIIVIGAWALQRKLMYFPDAVRTDPAIFDLEDVAEAVFKTPDGAEVISWWAKARPGKPTLLYFHGNAGALATRGERIRLYQSMGYGVFMMSYRGYGGSTGAPSERNNVRDARQAYDYLIGQGVRPDEIVLYGESIGSGVAVQVGAAKDVAGVILDAPYTTMVAVAELHYPYLPARWFMTDRYMSAKYIRKIDAPLLIVHGEDDVVIPVSMGQALFEMARQPKELAIIRGAGHNDHYSFGSYERIWNWLARLPADATGSSTLPRQNQAQGAAE